jgi:hypothetical protein
MTRYIGNRMPDRIKGLALPQSLTISTLLRSFELDRAPAVPAIATDAG